MWWRGPDFFEKVKVCGNYFEKVKGCGNIFEKVKAGERRCGGEVQTSRPTH